MKAMTTAAAMAAMMAVVPGVAQAKDKEKQPEAKISILVRSGATVGGFTDPSKVRQDSVKDLLKRLKDSDSLRPVDSESDALVVLEVMERETKRETNAWTAFNGMRQNKSYLTVKLTAGEYETEFTADGGSKGMMTGYEAAASTVVDQVEAWVKANPDRLLALRHSPTSKLSRLPC